MRLMLDPGHGGYDSGGIYKGRKEKDDNLDLALAVGELLENNGIEVSYTRVSDTYDSPLSKAKIANEEDVDLLVSFHRNTSMEANEESGVVSFIGKEGMLHETLAHRINKELEEIGFKNLGVEIRKDMAILRKTDMPAVMVYIGFINNDNDNELFDQKFDALVNLITGAIYSVTTGKELIYELPKEEIIVANKVNNESKRYYVQIGVFRDFMNAQKLARPLEVMGYPVRIDEIDNFYMVRIGDVATLAEATTLESDLKMLGYDTLLMAE